MRQILSPLDGIRSPFGRLMSSTAPFTPALLFAASEPGVWCDPSDLTTLFQDTAGTTPVTTPGQTVARINDKSGRGNNATQATTASRPIYGINPVGGRRNLLTFTEQFDNAAWTKTNQNSASVPTVTANAGTAPDGTMTAERVQFARTGTTATDRSRLEQQNVPISATTNYVFSVWMKSFGGANQTVTLFPNWGSGSALVVTVTSDWQRFSVSAASGASIIGTPVIGLGYTTNSVTSADVLVWGAQLETGSTATSYQRVSSIYDVTEAGVASVSYLAFDGVDDFMVTPTITPGIDKAQVFAGVRHLAALTGIVAETSTSIDSNNGVVRLTAQAAFNYSAGSKGTTAQSVVSPTIGVINTSVLAAIGDISAPSLNIRTNGVAATPVVLTQGTGNYLAYQLYIGRRAGTTAPLSGQLYSLLVRFGTNLTTDTITSTETWVAGRTGISI